MLNILMDTIPTGHDQANSRMIQLFYGIKTKMLELVATSNLADVAAIIVIELPPSKSGGYYFLNTGSASEIILRELFYEKLQIEELAIRILNGDFKR